jgi:predicted transcriptional regulator
MEKYTEVALNSDQYRRLREYALAIGQSPEDAIREAVADFIALTEAEQRQILDRR